MKMNNDYIYEAIKKSIINDIELAYEVFKEEEYDNLEGVILQLNSTKGFGEFIKKDPVKLADFMEHLYNNLEFLVHISFTNQGEDEFYPLLG